MTNARQKILNYIREEQCATVEELSRVYKVTPANIRHHLSILVEQGSLEIIGQKNKTGKGRPTQVYSAAQQTKRNNLDQLSHTLLCAFINSSQSEADNPWLHDIAKRMVSDYSLDKSNPTRCMYSSIRALNRMNYQAHWEAHIENPRIMLGHCPYRSILDHHPEICQLDEYILQELLGTSISLAEKLAPNIKGLQECIFQISRHLP